MSTTKMDYTNEPRRDILCIDIKSFFASVEAVSRGQHPLQSKIAVVSRAESSGGLVLAASPLVKSEYGVKTGTRVMDIPRHADIQVVPPRMNLYLKKNIEIINIFKRYVANRDLHVYSIDESFLDVTASHGLYGTTEEIARSIQRSIFKELGLISTVGAGDNPLLAKLCLDNEAKNNIENYYYSRWNYEDVPYTLWRIQSLTDFWGIGKRTEAKLNRLGIHSIYDLSQYSLIKIRAKFGKIGEEIFFHTHGIDRTRLSDVYEPKSNSFSKSQMLYRDYRTQEEVEIILKEMVEEVAFRLRKSDKITSLIHVRIGYSNTIEHGGFSRQMTISKTNMSKLLVKNALILFRKHYERYPVRHVAVSFGRIESGSANAVQLSLFEAPEDSIKDIQLDAVRDSIREKFGYTALLSATSLHKSARARERAKLLGGHSSGE